MDKKRTFSVCVYATGNQVVPWGFTVDDGWVKFSGIMFARDEEFNWNNSTKGKEGKYIDKVWLAPCVEKSLNWAIRDNMLDGVKFDLIVSEDEWVKPKIQLLRIESKEIKKDQEKDQSAEATAAKVLGL